MVLSMPASTAECERGFSRIKILKTENRNRLTANSMTDLLTVQLLSRDIVTFDPTPAIHHWNSSVQRRPQAKKHIGCESVVDLESDVSTDSSDSECDEYDLEKATVDL